MLKVSLVTILPPPSSPSISASFSLLSWITSANPRWLVKIYKMYITFLSQTSVSGISNLIEFLGEFWITLAKNFTEFMIVGTEELPLPPVLYSRASPIFFSFLVFISFSFCWIVFSDFKALAYGGDSSRFLEGDSFSSCCGCLDLELELELESAFFKVVSIVADLETF